jgi:hypothetical protein
MEFFHHNVCAGFSPNILLLWTCIPMSSAGCFNTLANTVVVQAPPSSKLCRHT